MSSKEYCPHIHRIVGGNFGVHMDSCHDADFNDLVVSGINYDGLWASNCDRSELSWITASWDRVRDTGRHGIVFSGGEDARLTDVGANANVNGYGVVMLNHDGYIMDHVTACANIIGVLFDNADGEVKNSAATSNDKYGFVDAGRKSVIRNQGRNNQSRDNNPNWSWDWHW